jgi:hypothetical protein
MTIEVAATIPVSMKTLWTAQCRGGYVAAARRRPGVGIHAIFRAKTKAWMADLRTP